MQSMYAPFALLAPFASVDLTSLNPLDSEAGLVVIDRVESTIKCPR